MSDGGREEETHTETISIIAVHGLGGHWESTWTGASGKLWLRDFLPGQLNDAGIQSRIMSFGYDSQTIFTQVATDIDGATAAFLNQINGQRLSAEKKARPLILVAHDMGGILVKNVCIRIPTCRGHADQILNPGYDSS